MKNEIIAALKSANISDDEGQFPSLFDMLDFSGENKARNYIDGLAQAVMDVLIPTGYLYFRGKEHFYCLNKVEMPEGWNYYQLYATKEPNDHNEK